MALGLGLLRIVLAVSVLLTHSSYSTSLAIPGWIAVKLFFIISGFYMAMILCEKYTDHLGSFYKNRFLRLYPIYIVAILLIFLADGVATILRGSALTRSSFFILYAYQNNDLSLSTSLFLLFSNISMLFQDVLFFLAPNSHGALMWASKEQMALVPFYKYLLIPQAWSLSLEITFYLIAPFIIARVSRIVLWMSISIAIRTTLFILGHDEEQFVYRFFPAELVFFLAGSLSYHVHQKIRLSFLTKFDRYFVAAIIVTIGVYQIIPVQFELEVRLALYLAVSIVIPYVFHRSKHNALDNQIGELSYPFYILHLFTLYVLQVLALRIGIDIHGPIFLIAWIASTLILSHAMIRFVQKPFDVARMRPLRH